MTNPKPNELISRWLRPENARTLRAVIGAIRSGGNLRDVSGLQEVNGRVDLRGLTLPSSSPVAQDRVGGVSFQWVRGRLPLRRVSLVRVDLSHANLGDIMWSDCIFTDLLLRGAKGNGPGFWGCKFRNVDFEGADLREFVFSGSNGATPNEFRDCRFDRAKMTRMSGGFALFDRCSFAHAKLAGTDFEGARFIRCRFEGMLDNVMFRRHARSVIQPLLPWQRFDPRKFVNEMVEVDFSGCNLRAVQFDGVDLSTCLFPRDANHLVIHDQHRVFKQACDIIASQWEGEEAKLAWKILDLMYVTPGQMAGWKLTPEALSQPIQVINRLDLQEYISMETGDKVYDLLRMQVQ